LNHVKIATTLFVQNAEHPCLTSILAYWFISFGGSLLGLWQETGNTGMIHFCIIQQFAKLE